MIKINNYNPDPLSISQEIEIWLGLLIDHARFMRNGFDTTEEKLFMRANNFSDNLEKLSQEIEIDEEEQQYFNALQHEVKQFINFKQQVARGISNCQILSILPAALIEHIKKEAIFFSGILARIQNEPRPTWRDLGLPDQRVASTAPQALIPELGNEIENITWEELLFWQEINFEHAEVLSLYFRPQQEEIRRATMEWGSSLKLLYDDVLRGFETGISNPTRYIRPVWEQINGWKEFLGVLYQQVITCNIPGGQMNIWPRVIDHMIREATYFLQVLLILGSVNI